MEAVILVIHLIVALSIIIVVMIQPAESGGFVGGGNMSGMMSPRRGADVMTRVTTVLACIFFATSLSLGIIASNASSSKEGILEMAAKNGVDISATAREDAKEDKTDVKKEKPVAPISK